MELIETILQLIDIHFRDLDWNNYDQRSLDFLRALERELTDRNMGHEQLCRVLVEWSETVQSKDKGEEALRMVGRLLSNPQAFDTRTIR
jgi:hypothetical protein